MLTLELYVSPKSSPVHKLAIVDNLNHGIVLEGVNNFRVYSEPEAGPSDISGSDLRAAGELTGLEQVTGEEFLNRSESGLLALVPDGTKMDDPEYAGVVRYLRGLKAVSIGMLIGAVQIINPDGTPGSFAKSQPSTTGSDDTTEDTDSDSEVLQDADFID